MKAIPTSPHRIVPFSQDKINELKSNHDLYDIMLARFGEKILHNYIDVEYVVLTEGKNIITAQGATIDVTRELIREVYQDTVHHWKNYLLNPVNKIKSWFDPTGKGMGYSPIMTNHKESGLVENKHGWILGNTWAIEEHGGVMVLKVWGRVVSPIAKWNHTQDLWKEVSPTFAKVSRRVIELSYVNIPAQATNTSLSTGDILQTHKLDNANKVKSKKATAKKVKQKQSVINSERQAKENRVDGILDNLFYSNVISSGQIKPLKDELLSLGAGDVGQSIAKIVSTIHSNGLYANKPKILFLKGKVMPQTDEQIYLAFKESQRDSFEDEKAFNRAFNDHLSQVRQQEQISLSSGDVIDPKENLIKAIELATKANIHTDPELQKTIAGALGLTSLGSGDANGGTQEAGGVQSPNNTQLSDGDKAKITAKAEKKAYKKQAAKDAKKAAKAKSKSASADNGDGSGEGAKSEPKSEPETEPKTEPKKDGE